MKPVKHALVCVDGLSVDKRSPVPQHRAQDLADCTALLRRATTLTGLELVDGQPLLYDISQTLRAVTETIDGMIKIVPQWGATTDIATNNASACVNYLTAAHTDLTSSTRAVGAAYDALSPWTTFDIDGQEIPKAESAAKPAPKSTTKTDAS